MATYKVPKVPKVSQTYVTPASTQEYRETFSEYIARVGEFTSPVATTTFLPTTLYTVPKGYTFFIFNATLGQHVQSGYATGNLQCYILTDQKRILTLWLRTEMGLEQAHIERSFPVPIKIKENSNIYLSTALGDSIWGGVSGYLVPNSVLKY